MPEQPAGIGETQEVGADGLWAKLKGRVVRVVLLTVDSVSGLIYPPVVVRDEDSASAWEKPFTRAQAAGLDAQKLRGLCSDGAQGLLAYLRRDLFWVLQQRCVWHIWRNLSGDRTRAVSQAAQGLADAAAEAVRVRVRGELVKLIRGVIDAQSASAAEAALAQLLAHPYGKGLGKQLRDSSPRRRSARGTPSLRGPCRGLGYRSSLRRSCSRGQVSRNERQNRPGDGASSVLTGE